MSQLCSAMLLLVLLFLLLSLIKAENPVKCSHESRSGTTFKPSANGAKGRYNVEWCVSANLSNTKATDNMAEWKMLVSYSVIRNESNCYKQTVPTKHKHSEVTELFDWHSVNCTDMCFSVQLDLIFSGCYVIENWLPMLSSKRYVSTQYIPSELTRESLTDNQVKAHHIPHEGYVSILWLLGDITASQYDMKLRQTHTTPGKEETEISIKDNCTIVSPRSNEIGCNLTGLNGTYDIYLTHHTPWKLGDFNKQAFSHYSFECVPQPSTQLSAADNSLVWACGAVAALAAGSALALAVWRWRGAARFRKRVLASWRHRLAEGSEPEHKQAAQPILLLYAREAPEAAPLVAALTELLQRAAPGQVYDLFSPEVVAMSAASPAEWLREALRRDNVRVILLQTPALAALYSPGADGPMDAPLLSRRCMLRSPAPGDTLLALALRLLAHTTTAGRPYNKYYLATVSGVETETLPCTVPFRRYVLPADGPRLLLDLCPAAGPAPDPPAALRPACQLFATHVAARPDYLREHLLLLD